MLKFCIDSLSQTKRWKEIQGRVFVDKGQWTEIPSADDGIEFVESPALRLLGECEPWETGSVWNLSNTVHRDLNGDLRWGLGVEKTIFDQNKESIQLHLPQGFQVIGQRKIFLALVPGLKVPGFKSVEKWSKFFSDILEGWLPADDFLVESTKRSWVSVSTFLFSPARKAAIREVEANLMRMAHQAANKNAELIIVAHSFGTHILQDVLSRQWQFATPKAIILCGSVIRPGIFFGSHVNNIPVEIINDCGLRDNVSVAAESATRIFEASGRFGIPPQNRPNISVYNRYWRELGHRCFFKPHFVWNQWLRWVIDPQNLVSNGDANGQEQNLAWWISKYKVILIFLLIMVIVGAVWVMYLIVE